MFTKLRRAWQLAKVQLTQTSEKQLRTAAQNEKERQLKTGQRVLVKLPNTKTNINAKFLQPWADGFFLLGQAGPVTYVLQNIKTNRQLLLHIDRIKAKFPVEFVDWRAVSEHTKRKMQFVIGDSDDETFFMSGKVRDNRNNFKNESQKEISKDTIQNQTNTQLQNENDPKVKPNSNNKLTYSDVLKKPYTPQIDTGHERPRILGQDHQQPQAGGSQQLQHGGNGDGNGRIATQLERRYHSATRVPRGAKSPLHQRPRSYPGCPSPGQTTKHIPPANARPVPPQLVPDQLQSGVGPTQSSSKKGERSQTKDPQHNQARMSGVLTRSQTKKLKELESRLSTPTNEQKNPKEAAKSPYPWVQIYQGWGSRRKPAGKETWVTTQKAADGITTKGEVRGKAPEKERERTPETRPMGRAGGRGGKRDQEENKGEKESYCAPKGRNKE